MNFPKRQNPAMMWWWTLGLITVIAAAARLINLSRPGVEIDENVYRSVAEHFANGQGIVGTPLYGNETAQYYGYQPPFYFLALGTWFKLFGSGVVEARTFSVFCSLIVLVLAAVYMRRRVAPLAGLITAGLIALDPWFIFENRIGWIENPLMILIVLALLAWDYAEKHSGIRWWVMVGAAFGAAFIFKQVAGLTIIAFAVAVIVGFRTYADTWGRRIGHLAAMLGSAAAVTVAYFAVMNWVYPGVFYEQTLNQLIRATGGRTSNGSLTFSGHAIYSALTSNYWLFFATALSCVIAWILMVRRFIRVRRGVDDWAGLRHLTYLSLGVMGLLPFAGLVFPHYLLIAFLPTFMYLGGEAYYFLRTPKRLAVFVFAGIFLVTGTVGSVIRLTWPHDDALPQAIAYLNANTGPGDVVVGDETVGVSLDGAAYCQTRKAGRCEGKATVLQTYLSQTQSLPPDPYVYELRDSLNECAEWKGFRETITVYMETCPK